MKKSPSQNVTRVLVLLGPLLIFGLHASAKPHSSEPLELGSRLELFVDDYLIDSLRDLRIQMHRPQAAGVALAFDQPWEGNVSWPVSVFQDGEIYRMYYLGRSAPEYARESGLKPGETVIPEHPPFLCYAESDDGIHWTKPSLGLIEFNGSTDNNIIYGGGHSLEAGPGTVFLDTNPETPPEERFKAVASTGINSRWPENLAKDPAGMLLSVSADGLNWKRWQDEPLMRTNLPNAFDSINVMFWSEVEEQYVFYLRFMSQNIRTFARATSKDLLTWTEPEPVSFGQNPMEHLYTNAATPYFRAPHLTLAFPKRYVPLRKKHADEKIPGISETVFMSSRDGVNWTPFREAFIRPGRDDRNWIHRTTSTSVGILPTADDEISLYVARHYTAPSVHLERFVLRTDGFSSISADAKGGEFVTKPMLISGEELIINYATSAAGSIRVEVQDINGHPLPGFELERSQTIWGDEIEGVVKWQRPEETWTDELKLSGLQEKPVRLRFVMKDADLYSLRFK